MPAMTVFKQLNLVSTLAFDSLLTDEPLSLLACYWENTQQRLLQIPKHTCHSSVILPCDKAGMGG